MSYTICSDCAVKEPNAEAQNMEDADRLWKLSEQLVGITQTKHS